MQVSELVKVRSVGLKWRVLIIIENEDNEIFLWTKHFPTISFSHHHNVAFPAIFGTQMRKPLTGERAVHYRSDIFNYLFLYALRVYANE